MDECKPLEEGLPFYERGAQLAVNPGDQVVKENILMAGRCRFTPGSLRLIPALEAVMSCTAFEFCFQCQLAALGRGGGVGAAADSGGDAAGRVGPAGICLFVDHISYA